MTFSERFRKVRLTKGFLSWINHVITFTACKKDTEDNVVNSVYTQLLGNENALQVRDSNHLQSESA